MSSVSKREKRRDFPGGPVVKDLPANIRDLGSSPGPGISHMLWGSYACVPQPLNPVGKEPVLHNKRPPQREACALLLESSPHLPQLEKVCLEQQTPRIAKIINRKSAEPSLEIGRNQGRLAGRDIGKTNRN